MIVLAEDLIWQSRLVDALKRAGATPERAATARDLDRLLAAADALVVDLTARGYDPIGSIERAAAAGRPVLAVGQHDDVPLRKQALAAGADRVFSYRRLFEAGPETLTTWLSMTSAHVEAQP